MLSNYNNKVEPSRDSNRERGRKGEKQTDRERKRQRETDRQRNEETERVSLAAKGS